MKKICILFGSVLFWGLYLNISTPKKTEVKELKQTEVKEECGYIEYEIYIDNITATVYNAHPNQCNLDCFTTASGFKIDKINPERHRIIAIERTMMKRYGLKMGDKVYISGAGEMDGVWYIEDKMNKRFKNQNKIDFLVEHNRKTGKWDNVVLYKLKNT